jgi:hypothetical protein
VEILHFFQSESASFCSAGEPSQRGAPSVYIAYSTRVRREKRQSGFFLQKKSAGMLEGTKMLLHALAVPPIGTAAKMLFTDVSCNGIIASGNEVLPRATETAFLS